MTKKGKESKKTKNGLYGIANGYFELVLVGAIIAFIMYLGIVVAPQYISEYQRQASVNPDTTFFVDKNWACTLTLKNSDSFGVDRYIMHCQALTGLDYSNKIDVVCVGQDCSRTWDIIGSQSFSDVYGMRVMNSLFDQSTPPFNIEYILTNGNWSKILK